MVLGHLVKEGERTDDVRTSQEITFDSMLLARDTSRGLKTSGFYKPSPIQLHGIPLGKCGFDLLLEAKSGTGKTAVFSVITLEKIDLNKGLQTVILAPTREIAAQICDVIRQIGSHYEGLKVEVVMGGLPVHEDIEKFKSGEVHIVVGSPGRLRHLIQDKHIDVSIVRLLVLDEADKLMEKSFLADINFIFTTLPKEKQVIMSSATYPEITKTFIQKYVENAQHVCPDNNNILLGIKQRVTFVKYNSNIVKQTKNRFEELLKILSNHSFKQCLIFCNYQARIAELHKMLKREKWPAHQLYGQQEQLDRLHALKSLQEYKCRILISTDLAARGIDASNVDLVINFEPPYDWQTYLHRIGRAGRFGSYGIAITILSEGNEQRKFAQTLDAIKAPINVCNMWTDEEPANREYKDKELNSDNCTNGTAITESPKDIVKIAQNTRYEPHKAELNIDSFENLCLSFEQPEIESFFHLLSSHQNNISTKSVAKDSSYMHLQIKQMPLAKEVCETSCNGVKLTEELCDNVRIPGESNNNKHHDIPYVVDERVYTNDLMISEAEYYVPNIEEDLLKAGLPTAFGSSKKNNNRNSKILIKDNTLDMNLDTTSNQNNHPTPNTNKKNSSKIENCYTDWKNMKINEQDSFFTSSLVSSSDCIESCAATRNSCHITSTHRNTKSRVNGKHHRNAMYDSRIQSQDYTSWYNNLKLRMKQIEHAIYVDEMSRL